MIIIHYCLYALYCVLNLLSLFFKKIRQTSDFHSSINRKAWFLKSEVWRVDNNSILFEVNLKSRGYLFMENDEMYFYLSYD